MDTTTTLSKHNGGGVLKFRPVKAYVPQYQISQQMEQLQEGLLSIKGQIQHICH
jgi:hypothetical protein